MNNIPSIFNDVIGPVMRGPSSSHTAASWRIARISLDILNEPLKKAVIDFDKNGIWALNYREQGTVLGINGGLLGLEMTDSLMKNTEMVAEEKGISITYEINSFPTKHANTVRLLLEGINGRTILIVTASLGGGSFEIQQIDGYDVNICGDYYELLALSKTTTDQTKKLKKILSKNMLLSQSTGKNGTLINLKSPIKISDDIISHFNNSGFGNLIIVNPILPIVSGNDSELPFTTIESLIEYGQKEDLDLGELGLIYEKCRSGFSDSVLLSKIEELIDIIENSIQTGLEGTKYEDRILHQQSHLIGKAEKVGKILQNSLVNNIITYVSAIMESKSAMGLIVAAPTAGACGGLPGACIGAASALGLSQDDITRAMLAGGVIGIFIAAHATFAAEVGGCQAECGAGSGMAAAALVTLAGGSTHQAVNAASMALQNILGMICDPVANRVEVPCLGKNVMAASNALACANMALADYDPVIPLDEVIQTMDEVGKMLPSALRCTALGGLSITKTSKEIEKRLAQKDD